MAPARISLALALNLLITTTSGPLQAMPVPADRRSAGRGRSESLTCTTGPRSMNSPVRLMASVRLPPPLLAQVEDHGVDALRLKVVQDPLHVAGGALEIGRRPPSPLPCPCRNWADRSRRSCTACRPDLRPSSKTWPWASLSFSSILARVILYDLRFGAAGRNHFQPDDRARLAADHLDHVAELHVDDVDHFAVLALRPRRRSGPRASGGRPCRPRRRE